MSNDTIPQCAQYDSVEALLVGAGRGGTALLEIFDRYDWLHLKGVIDLIKDAPGMQYAESLRIPTYTNISEVLYEFDGDMIIDVTGDVELSKTLNKFCIDKKIEVISGKAVKLIFDLVKDQIKDQEELVHQNSQLQLLRIMMQVSYELRKSKGEETLLNQGMHGSAMMIVSSKAIALEIKKSKLELIGGIGIENIHDNLQNYDKDFVIEAIQKSKKDDELLIELESPLVFSDPDEGFQLAVPLYVNYELHYVLLFQLQSPLQDDAKVSLKMLLSHLQLAIEAESHQKLLQELAYRDPLTSVYNRRFFDERLEQELERLRRASHGDIAIMFIDIDYFKKLNDTYGHQVGDRVLRTVAKTIHNKLRSYDVLARYGGDEFIAILSGFQVEAIQHIADRILSAATICKPDGIDINDFPKEISMTIGIAIAHFGTNVSATDLIDFADQALYTAKQSSRGSVHIVKWQDPENESEQA